MLCKNYTSPLVIAITIKLPRMSASDKPVRRLPIRSERSFPPLLLFAALASIRKQSLTSEGSRSAWSRKGDFYIERSESPLL